MPTVLPPSVRFQRPAAFVPVGYQQAECAGCKVAVVVRKGTVQPMCRECQRGQVLADINRVMQDINDLRDGSGVFEGMTTDERDEQLVAMGLPKISSKPRFPGFANLSDDNLIAIVAGDAQFRPGEKEDAIAEATVELSKRLAGFQWAPLPNERAEIERNAVVIASTSEPDTDWDGMA